MPKQKNLFLSVISCAFAGVLLLTSMVYKNKAQRSIPFTAAADTEQNRFNKKVLSEKLDEPLQMIIFKDSKVLFIERKGNIKLYNPATNATTIVATIPVSTKYKSKEGNISEAEDGLLGVVLDPDFDKNHWLYLYYSEAGDDPKNILTRYEYVNNQLILSSKKVLLEVPVQREQCCHTGGKMVFDENKNMYLTTGDNTSSKATAYSPADEREGRSAWDAQRTSGNTNDLRGKILRIHPEPNGTYSVPEGNLFAKGTEKTKPEVYVMGIRNPYSIFYDMKSKYLYWGEVGPDAGRDSVNRGPRSYDEWNRTNKPGFFGWPYFQADSKPYYKYDFTTGKSGELFDPQRPVNTSPNNTGLNVLPPTNKALIWYSYDASAEFPILGTGGRSAMVGPVYHADDYAPGKRFPDYYNNKLFIFEWLRDWIITVTLDKDGNYQSMERFLPDLRFSHPMDVKFGPDGDMYVLEYGQGWFTQNNDAQLVRVTYNGGNRKPEAMAAVDKPAGGLPLKVNLSAAGTTDFDHDALTYKWAITSPANKKGIVLKGEKASYTFLKKGNCKATLTVTDAKGASSSKTLSIKAGNEPPVVTIDVAGNQSFYFPGKPLSYSVKMRDKEDGIIPGGKIPADKLKISIDYVGKSTPGESVLGHQAAPENFLEGKALISKSDCKACHDETRKIIGPAYKSIAAKYKMDDETVEKLATKVINGGNGVWGEMSMSAHPQLPKDDAKAIVKYILSLSSAPAVPKNLASKGTYTAPDGANGTVTIKASYTDKGVLGITSASAQRILVLNNPAIPAASAKFEGQGEAYNKRDNNKILFINKSGAISFAETDMTGITGLDFGIATPNNLKGGKIEARLDNVTGELLGSATVASGLTRTVISATTKPIKGKHTLYLVFSGTDKQENLFLLDTVTFKSE